MIEAFRLGVVSREGTLWDGLDLAFPEGEAWCLTGPGSSGKSVLLRILRGDRRPDAGEVMVAGESLYRGNADAAFSFRLLTGVVPESFPHEPGRMVSDLFRRSAAAGPQIPRSERSRREQELLALVGMEKAGRWDLSDLSLSERARAELASELLRGPRYLFTDMLLANAGKEWTEMIGALFRALAREGRTIVMAERVLPDRWAAGGGGEGPARGPFRLTRISPGGGER